jgi:hypothetical protein
MSIFEISNFYNFYYYIIKNIDDQNYASACMKQSTVSIKLRQREYYTSIIWFCFVVCSNNFFFTRFVVAK